MVKTFLLTASMMYQYFVKIVPTIYVKTDGEVSRTVSLCLLFKCTKSIICDFKKLFNLKKTNKHINYSLDYSGFCCVSVFTFFTRW